MDLSRSSDSRVWFNLERSYRYHSGVTRKPSESGETWQSIDKHSMMAAMASFPTTGCGSLGLFANMVCVSEIKPPMTARRCMNNRSIGLPRMAAFGDSRHLMLAWALL